jgi:SAM-dependent methyltransferase
MSDSIQTFYDQMAASYHLIFPDWERSVERQAEMLDGLIRAELNADPASVRLLDCACGIGTQAIGLARRGYRLHATDLSPEAVARAGVEAARAGLSIATGVADMRALAAQVRGPFEAAIACDNALPHLLTEADLALALAQIRAVLAPGGLFLASIRDYDAIRAERPRFTSERLMDGPEGRRITFQVWDWWPDGEGYTVHQFILTQANGEWQTRHYATDYRALRRVTLTAALAAVGFEAIRWDLEGYVQPVVLAKAPKAMLNAEC